MLRLAASIARWFKGRVTAASALLVIFLALTAGCAPDHASIAIDPAHTFQVMSGWEVTANVDPRVSPAYFDFVVDTVGINRLRVEVMSGIENTSRARRRAGDGQMSEEEWRSLRYATVNDNDDPRTINPEGFDFSDLDATITAMVLPVRDRLTARGERLFLNFCYVAFTKQTTGTYVHARPEEYAEFVLATYLHLQERFGMVPDAWEVILEPDNTGTWTGTMIGQAMVAAAARLREHGFVPRFIAPSVSEMSRAPRYIQDIARVPGAMELVSELSYHRYGLRSRNQMEEIAELEARYEKPASMLELWFGRGTYDVLHEDLAYGGNVAWQGTVLTTMVRPDNLSGPPFTINDDTRMNLQYFRYVRAGAVRIGASSSADGWFDPLAFVNTDGGQVVVVKARAAGQFTVSGLSPGRYAVSYATGTESVIEPELRDVQPGALLSVAIPGRGVATIARRPIK